MATFGYTTVGAISDDVGDFSSPGVAISKFLSPADAGALTKITAYIYAKTGGTNPIAAKAAIYADVLGSPGALLATSSEVTGITDTPAWYDFTVSCTLQPYTYYWLALYSASDFMFNFDSSTTSLMVGADSTDYPNFPNPFLSSTVIHHWSIPYVISIYATYTPSSYGSGSSGWAIIGSLSAVSLPSAPKVCNDQNPTDITIVKVAGQAPVLIGVDLAERTLRLEGSVWVHGQTNADLEANYLAPLRSMAMQAVTIIDPDSQFAGSGWILKEPDFKREAEGAEVRYTYTLTFLQGQAVVVLQSSGGSFI
jgi:hypothetical protein